MKAIVPNLRRMAVFFIGLALACSLPVTRARTAEAPPPAAEIYISHFPANAAQVYINNSTTDAAAFIALPCAATPGEIMLAVRPLAAAFGFTPSGVRDTVFLRDPSGEVISLVAGREYAAIVCPEGGRRTVALAEAPVFRNLTVYLNAHALAALLGYAFIDTVNEEYKIVFHFLTRNEGAETRYTQNRLVFDEFLDSGGGFIYGQNGLTIRRLRVGPFGTGGNHGCGPIAVYNALLYLHRSHPTPYAVPHPASVIRYLDYRGGMNLGGLAGTHPDILASYLRRAGYATDMVSVPTHLDGPIRESAVSILLYGRARGGFFVHYVMVRYEEERFYVYNEFGNDTEARRYESMDGWIQTRGYRAVALITVG